MNSLSTSKGDAEHHVLDWADGDVPVSQKFDDPFFSKSDGRAETRHVFLDGNGLPDAWSKFDLFQIGELGFGTGLNFLETLSLWRRTRTLGQKLHFNSVEAFPLQSGEIKRALGNWNDLSADVHSLLQVWKNAREETVWIDEQTSLRVFEMDVVQALAQFPQNINAWFFDGFSPAKNPEMWTEHVMQLVADHTLVDGTFSSYSSAGWVRRNIEAAGFSVERVAGFGRKRHMIIGRLAKTS